MATRVVGSGHEMTELATAGAAFKVPRVMKGLSGQWLVGCGVGMLLSLVAPLRAVDVTRTGEVKQKTSIGLAELAGLDPEVLKNLYDLNALSVQPRPRFQAKPIYPLELRKAGITGEALVGFIVTSSGEVAEVYVIRATHPEFGATAVAAVSRWKFRPGLVGDRKVNTRMSVPIRFNIAGKEPPPKGLAELADLDQEMLKDFYDLNALSVQPAPRFQSKPIYPFELRQTGVTGEAMVGFIVTTSGNVVEAYVMRATHPDFGTAAVAAVSRWKFRPGMLGDRKVNTRMSVPVIFNIEVHPGILAGEFDEPPSVLRGKNPRYPGELKRHGRGGQVFVSLTVNERGEPEGASIKGSTYPGLDDEALNVVERWKFKPAEKEGKKIAANLDVQVVFAHQGKSIFGAGWQPKRPKAFPPALAEVYHWDKAPVVRDYYAPVYPRSALEEKRKGKVLVKFLVSSTGEVERAEAAGNTDEDLMAAAVAAVSACGFFPAQRGGKPSPAWLEFDFNWSSRSHAPVNDRTERILKLMLKTPDKVVAFTKLDARAKLLVSQAPVVPPSRKIPPEGIEVRVDVVIDRSGVVRLPQAQHRSDRELGFAAVQAIAGWRFEVPRQHGLPVDAYVTIPIVFKPDE